MTDTVKVKKRSVAKEISMDCKITWLFNGFATGVKQSVAKEVSMDFKELHGITDTDKGVKQFIAK